MKTIYFLPLFLLIFIPAITHAQITVNPVVTVYLPGPVASTATSTTSSGASNLKAYLYFGTSGDQVKLLQTLLAKDPDVYPEGIISGTFGALTLEAVKRFQLKFSVVGKGTYGYGYVGPKTRAQLLEIYGN